MQVYPERNVGNEVTKPGSANPRLQAVREEEERERKGERWVSESPYDMVTRARMPFESEISMIEPDAYVAFATKMVSWTSMFWLVEVTSEYQTPAHPVAAPSRVGNAVRWHEIVPAGLRISTFVLVFAIPEGTLVNNSV